jgi:hypothetical protein
MSMTMSTARFTPMQTPAVFASFTPILNHPFSRIRCPAVF